MKSNTGVWVGPAYAAAAEFERAARALTNCIGRVAADQRSELEYVLAIVKRYHSMFDIENPCTDLARVEVAGHG